MFWGLNDGTKVFIKIGMDLYYFKNGLHYQNQIVLIVECD